MTLVHVVKSNVIILSKAYYYYSSTADFDFLSFTIQSLALQKKPKIPSLERLIFTFWETAGIYSALICISFLLIRVFNRNLAKEERPNTRLLVSSNPNFL